VAPSAPPDAVPEQGGARPLLVADDLPDGVVVVDAAGTVIGRVGVIDLLQPRLHDLTEEHHRARTLGFRTASSAGDAA